MRNIRDVMTQPVLSVRTETPLREVALLLSEHRISGLPVVDAEGAVVGIVSEADLLMKEQGPDAIHHRRFARFIGESRESQAQLAKIRAVTAGEAMTAPAVTITPDRRLSVAAGLMVARKVNRLPVVDDGRLIGIVTRADLVRAYVRSDDELARTIRDDVLFRVLWLDPSSFTVSVKDGVAAISGRVERRSTADMIERSTRMVPGILDVGTDVVWSIDDSKAGPPPVDVFLPIGPR